MMIFAVSIYCNLKSTVHKNLKLRFLTICGDTCDESNLKKSERFRFKSAENVVHLSWNDPTEG
jgi:hypothetical protein